MFIFCLKLPLCYKKQKKYILSLLPHLDAFVTINSMVYVYWSLKISVLFFVFFVAVVVVVSQRYKKILLFLF